MTIRDRLRDGYSRLRSNVSTGVNNFRGNVQAIASPQTRQDWFRGGGPATNIGYQTARTLAEPIKMVGRGVGTAIRTPIDMAFNKVNAQTDTRLQNTLRSQQQRAMQSGDFSTARDRSQKIADIGQRQAGRQISFGQNLGQVRNQTAMGAGQTGLMALGLGAGLPAIGASAGLSGGLGYGVTKLAGGSNLEAQEAAGQGLGRSLQYAGINRLTQPVINPVMSAMGTRGLLPRMAVGGGINAGANILEDELLTRVQEGRSQTGTEAAVSGLIGAALGAGVGAAPEIKRSISRFVQSLGGKVGKDGYIRNKAGQLFNPANGQWVKATKKVEKVIKQAQDKLVIDFIRDPKNPNRFLRTENGRVPVQPKVKGVSNLVARQDGSGMVRKAPSRLNPEPAYGAMAGIEFDEEGNVSFNPEKAALGIGVMGGVKAAKNLPTKGVEPQNFSFNMGRGVKQNAQVINTPEGKRINIVGDTLKPKTKLLQQADNLEAKGQLELEQNRVAAQLAQEEVSTFSQPMLQKINKLKQLSRSKSFQEGDIESLRKKDGKLVDEVVEAVRESRMNESIPDEEALEIALSLPRKQDLRVKTPQEILEAREMRKQAKQLQDLVYNSETDPKTIQTVFKNNQKQIERTAKYEYNEWEKSLREQEGARFTQAGRDNNLAEGVAEVMQSGTLSPAVRDVAIFKDISSVSTGFRDVYRNFEKVFGKQFPAAKRVLLDPFDKAKGELIKEQQVRLGQLENYVEKQLGITKGSQESRAVQLYGEGQLNQQDLIGKFGKEKAKNIELADAWFRDQYDTLLAEVNAVRARIYPNNPEKQIPKRKDYYRHYREMAQGFGGLKNLFETPSNISPELEGVSATTKPKTKWLSFAQQRLGTESEIDAVGGFLDYLKGATYAKHIDPFIPQFRAMREELVQQTSNPQDLNYGKVNNFIRFLDNFADDLAGKTNPADRYLQDITGRKAFGALNWLNNRVKANVILGNVSSSIAQIFNVPQGMANAGPRQWIPGITALMQDVFGQNTPIKQSNFINERYFRSFDKFDRGMINDGRKLAGWITGVLDEVGTKYVWNMHYSKAIAEKIPNPVKYADDITRKMVGGRGIGEVPITQKAKVFQLIAPFQLEVANLWHVQKEFVDDKAFGKLATLYMLNWAFNRGAEQIRGSDVTFDPIQATIEAYQAYQEEDDKKAGAMRAAGRITGEALSNIPIGQTIATMYPEYGFSAGEFKAPTREKLFGEGDPTRFGSGLLAAGGVQDPVFKILPPYGGNQLKRTIQGVGAFSRGHSESASGRVRYPIAQTPKNAIQSAVFGQYSVPEAREYFDSGTSTLGDSQSEFYRSLPPEQRQGYYNQVISRRDSEKKEQKPGLLSGLFGQKAKANTTDGLDAYFGLEEYNQLPSTTNQQKAIKEAKRLEISRKVITDEDVDAKTKVSVLKKLGEDIQAEDVEYYQVANLTEDIKMGLFQDVIESSGDNKMEMLEGYRKGVLGKQVLTDSLITKLRKEGFISQLEASRLKSIQKDGTFKAGKGKKVKVPSLVSTSELLAAFKKALQASAPTKQKTATLGDLLNNRRKNFKLKK